MPSCVGARVKTRPKPSLYNHPSRQQFCVSLKCNLTMSLDANADDDAEIVANVLTEDFPEILNGLYYPPERLQGLWVRLLRGLLALPAEGVAFDGMQALELLNVAYILHRTFRYTELITDADYVALLRAPSVQANLVPFFCKGFLTGPVSDGVFRDAMAALWRVLPVMEVAAQVSHDKSFIGYRRIGRSFYRHYPDLMSVWALWPFLARVDDSPHRQELRDWMRRTRFARVLLPLSLDKYFSTEAKLHIQRWADVLPDLPHALHIIHQHHHEKYERHRGNPQYFERIAEASCLPVIETLEKLAADRWSANLQGWLAAAARAAAARAVLRRQGVRPDAVVADSEDDVEGGDEDGDDGGGDEDGDDDEDEDEEDDDEEDDEFRRDQPPWKRRMYHSEIGDGAFDDSTNLVSSVEGGAAGGGSAAAAPMPPTWFWT